MADWTPYLIAIAAVALWPAFFFYLQRRKFLEPRNVTLAGPIVMWKTGRGRALIDRLARPKRFWRAFGDLSIVLVGVTMVAVTVLLLWEATLVQSAAVRANPPSPDLLLGLPGINPVIPLGYGVFGLAVAIVLHEFCHGILARAVNIRVRSVGAIFLVVPIGAFVEPDEEELRALPPRQRARLYAAGPATNILLAVLFAFLFSSIMLSAVAPAHNGVGIVGFTPQTSGAEAAGIQSYTIITGVNGTAVNSYNEFLGAMALVHPNQTIAVQTYDPADGITRSYTVTLGRDPTTGRPLLGIYALDVSTDYYHPLTNPSQFGGVPGAILTYITLPFSGRAPIQDPTLRFYRVSGPLAALPAPLFWLLTNTLYWLFWLNAMLGATNALPAVPLDGGYVFKDGMTSLLARVRRGIKAEDRDRIAQQVSYLFALLILSLVLWQLIGPRI
ncbi:MAG TPA: site-2 protease family protein [Thermoplasmata archaeon]|nr:site-2 protease family protein [Thermoplasmata archaeon]